MLYELSLFNDLKHDSHVCGNKWVIIDNSRRTNEEFPEYCSPQFEIFLDLKNDVQRSFEEE